MKAGCKESIFGNFVLDVLIQLVIMPFWMH